MVLKTYLIIGLLSFSAVTENKCGDTPNKPRVRVIGIATPMKHNACIMTDQNVRYFLDGIDDWDDEIIGKKVKVTGRLVIKRYDYTEEDEKRKRDTVITAIPQRRLGTWVIIEKPKWKLIK